MDSGILGQLKGLSDLKKQKRRELQEIYENLITHDIFLDLIMIQIAKEIEEQFKGIRFQIISRVKSRESFDTKLNNLLVNAKDEKSVKEIMIFDILALSIVVEEVPTVINTTDEEFNLLMDELLKSVEETRTSIKISEEEIKNCDFRFNETQQILKKTLAMIAQNKEIMSKLNPINDSLVIDILRKNNEHLEEVLENYKKRIQNIENDRISKKRILKRAKERAEIENDKCSYRLSKYFVTYFETFDLIKAFDLKAIPGRLKNFDKDNGYRATHNSYISNVILEGENIKIMFELQGKSEIAFYKADKGRAALYHRGRNVNFENEVAKSKELPDVLSIITDEQKQKFVKLLKLKIPKFRIYSSCHNGYAESMGRVYTLSLRENFVHYYKNDLEGNESLGIEPNPEVYKKFISEDYGAEMDQGSYFEL